MSSYRETYARWRDDPEGYWAEAAGALEWFRRWDRVLDATRAPFVRWFDGGLVNACHEALDRHVAAGQGARLALIHDSPLGQRQARYSYAELRARVAELAGWLAGRGVRTGDRVLIYMPLVPEAVMAMLACARLGAIHSVVFGGFGAKELAVRIDDAQPRLVLTASCGLEPGRIVAYKPLLDRALEMARHRVERCLVLQRPELAADLVPGRDLDWQTEVPGSAPHDCVPVPSTHPLYILYTSGTTGMPKGVVRDTGGYLVALRRSMRDVYGVAPGEVFWAASDIGWVVGHSYIVYGPLAHGCTTILYEGKPVGTPDAGAYWRVCAEHGVDVLFTAPTAVRAIKREDPECRLRERHGPGRLRALFLAGERADPDTVRWAESRLGVPVIDHWWQTETGWPVAANCLGLERLPVKPGSATVPVPGFDVRILDDQGLELGPGMNGAIVLRLPLPPGCLTTLWNDDAGFQRAYLERFPGWYHTGDGGTVDADGYVHVMGRTDDVINVAGHRLSSGEIEQAIAGHADVAECAVIPVPDELKGHVPLGLAVLKAGVARPHEEIRRELVARVRDEVGPVASFRECLIVERLPKTRSGKVLRGTLRRIAAAEPYVVPPTIEDPAVLEQLEARLRERKASP